METTRRNFLKIMVAGAVVVTVPIPVLAKGVVPKPWPVGEPRMVFFKMKMMMTPRPDGPEGMGWDMAKYVVDAIEKTIGPMATTKICSAAVASQEDMDLLEQQEGWRGWVASREVQLVRMLELPGEQPKLWYERVTT